MKRRGQLMIARPRPAADFDRRTPTYLRTAVEVHRDGSREVYHSKIAPAQEGWAWTHPSTPEAKAACSACTRGVLESVRGAPR